jgi:hypothetical protein
MITVLTLDCGVQLLAGDKCRCEVPRRLRGSG